MAEVLEQLTALLEEVPTGYQPMPSSMILGAEYFIANQVLQVTFVSGRVYTYLGVPLAVYRGLLDAPSKGRYMRAAIIGVYD
jgi:hypothetical protein